MDEYIYNGMGLEVIELENSEVGFVASVQDGIQHVCHREDAIAAAKAILKYYGENDH